MPRAKRCPVCGSAMRNYSGRWKCTDIKAHDKAKRNPNKPGQVRNPRGRNKTSTPVAETYRRRRGQPSRPGGKKGRYVLTDCPRCENGRRANPWTCGLCSKYGRIWTIE